MTFFKSKKGATVVLVLSILFGVFFGTYHSAMTAQRKVETTFQNEVAELADLRTDVAFNVVSLGNKVGANTDAIYDYAVWLRDEATDIRTVCGLQNAMTKVWPTFDDVTLSQEDAASYQNLTAQFESWLFAMSKTSYNQAAADFNATVYRAPLVRLFGVNAMVPIER